MILALVRMMIDGVGLFLSVYLVNSQVAEFSKTMIVSFAIGAVNAILLMVLGQTLGYVALVPIILLDGFIIMYFLHLTLQQAGVSMAVYAAYQIGLAILFSYVWKTYIAPLH